MEHGSRAGQLAAAYRHRTRPGSAAWGRPKPRVRAERTGQGRPAAGAARAAGTVAPGEDRTALWRDGQGGVRNDIPTSDGGDLALPRVHARGGAGLHRGPDDRGHPLTRIG
ncbi:hypothetical protein [Kitasatospora sp. NPDC005748]|uniref:hypothetical protein n=1 Tax=Kitasatospora sp. NPDC005748 TaxID=3157063 RepID=UPI0033E0A9E9